MANTLKFLIPKANAQASDAIAQPTFGILTSGAISSNPKASILLTASDTAVNKDETFKVTVKLNTADITIEQYNVVIEYDSSLLTVIDSDTVTAGTQIKFLDSVFQIADKANDNLASTGVGRIKLKAKIPSTTELSVNTDIAEITFKALDTGTVTVKLVEGNLNTQLTKTAGTSVAYSPNQVNIDISTLATTNPVTPVNPTPVITNPTPGGSTTILPNTALPAFWVNFLVIFSSLLSIALGVVLRTNSNKKTTGPN